MGKDVMFLKPVFTTADRFTVYLRSYLSEAPPADSVPRGHEAMQLAQIQFLVMITISTSPQGRGSFVARISHGLESAYVSSNVEEK